MLTKTNSLVNSKSNKKRYRKRSNITFIIAIGAALQPLYGRPGKAVEVASLVGYLLSDEASFISGTNIKADGLWSLSGGGM